MAPSPTAVAWPTATPAPGAAGGVLGRQLGAKYFFTGKITDIRPPEDIPDILSILKGGEARLVRQPTRHLTKDGTKCTDYKACADLIAAGEGHVLDDRLPVFGALESLQGREAAVGEQLEV